MISCSTITWPLQKWSPSHYIMKRTMKMNAGLQKLYNNNYELITCTEFDILSSFVHKRMNYLKTINCSKYSKIISET